MRHSLRGVNEKKTIIFNMKVFWDIALCYWVKGSDVSKRQSFYLQPAAVQSLSAA
jgi:hypothetical protein